MPFSRWEPKGWHSNWLSIKRCEAALTMTVLGPAKACSRAAILGVSPSASCSVRPPAPISPITANTDLERLWPGLSPECLDDFQPRAHRPPRIIFMGDGIPKVHQQPVAQILREVAVMALDHGRTGLLILLHDRAVVLGIELRGEGG
jgi:hypothetical protein